MTWTPCFRVAALNRKADTVHRVWCYVALYPPARLLVTYIFLCFGVKQCSFCCFVALCILSLPLSMLVRIINVCDAAVLNRQLFVYIIEQIAYSFSFPCYFHVLVLSYEYPSVFWGAATLITCVSNRIIREYPDDFVKGQMGSMASRGSKNDRMKNS